MTYIKYYDSPLGKILLKADETGLIGIWFDGEKYHKENLSNDCIEIETRILAETVRWLNIYFDGKEPNFMVPIHLIGSSFQVKVRKILLKIPYGKTITYGEISRQLKKELGIKKMSAQAVGVAIGHNKISIIIPCHRVIGTNGNLTGYAGGIERKIKLLELEKVDISKFYFKK